MFIIEKKKKNEVIGLKKKSNNFRFMNLPKKKRLKKKRKYRNLVFRFHLKSYSLKEIRFHFKSNYTISVLSSIHSVFVLDFVDYDI